MPFMICFGGNRLVTGASTGTLARAVRAPAVMKPIPLMNSATLTAKIQYTDRIVVAFWHVRDRYDSAAKHLFAGYGGGALAAVTLVDRKALGEAKLSGHGESFELDSSASRVLQLPPLNQLAVVGGSSTTGRVILAKSARCQTRLLPRHRVGAADDNPLRLAQPARDLDGVSDRAARPDLPQFE
jgi:hypothetical protein